MSQKTRQYAIESLAACGFAVMRSAVAWQQRPDLWGSAQECGVDFSSKATDALDGVQRLTVTLEGFGEVPVLTRSVASLDERIEWVTGYRVVGVFEEVPQVTAPAVNPAIAEAQKRKAEELDKLRKLAAQEPLVQDCHDSREILKAREQLARMETDC